MSKGAINQRLKFLITELSPSVREFSEAIGDSSSNTQNYIGSRQTEPKPEYLAKVLKHFRQVNAHWLLTGEGEPFLSGSQGNVTQTGTFNQAGTRNKQTNTNSGPDGNANAALDSANKEITLLREQLAMKDQLIAAKEEMLTLLRSQFNRPN